MNWENFSTWFSEQLLPHIPSHSLIILARLCPFGIQAMSTKDLCCDRWWEFFDVDRKSRHTKNPYH
jgi:hypothetical protein